VNCHRLPPLLAANVLDLTRGRAARIGDQHVEPAEVLRGLLDSRHAIAFARHVELQGMEPASQCLDLPSQRLRWLAQITSGDCDICAQPRQMKGDRRPDSQRAAGD
jgi:hypothetical protein